MLQKWIKAEEAADTPAGEGVAIIRPDTRHNGKETTICQLRPAPKMSPASVTSHLGRRLVVQYRVTDQLRSSGYDTKSGLIW